MIIWHNNRCSKSRCTLQIMEEQKMEFEVVNYLENIPSKEELKRVIALLNISAEALVRKGEPVFKEKFKGKTLSEEKWIDAMLEYPKLIERPIVIDGDKAVIGRPPENVLELKA